jgi:hypothetical protein
MQQIVKNSVLVRVFFSCVHACQVAMFRSYQVLAVVSVRGAHCSWPASALVVVAIAPVPLLFAWLLFLVSCTLYLHCADVSLSCYRSVSLLASLTW